MTDADDMGDVAPGFRQKLEARDFRVCRLYTVDRLSMPDIARQTSLSRSAIHRILHRYGVPIRERGGAPRPRMSAYGPFRPTRMHPADLGLVFRASGVSDIDLHGARMYQATAHVCTRGQADLHAAATAGQPLPNQQHNGETA